MIKRVLFYSLKKNKIKFSYQDQQRTKKLEQQRRVIFVLVEIFLKLFSFFVKKNGREEFEITLK